MAWAKFIGSAVKDSNQLTLLSSVPASQIPKGYEVLVGDIGNLEVSYGTSVMYDSEGKPFSHLYLVRTYTGETSNDIEIIVKPTGSNLNEAVDIFRSGSNQLNQLTALYRQFVEGNSPFTYQPFDDAEGPIEIKPILLLQSESDLILSNLTDSTNSVIQSANIVVENADQAVTDSLLQINTTITNANQALNDSVTQSEEKIDAAIVASSQTVNESITQYGVTIDAAIASANQSIGTSVSQSESRIDTAIASADQAVLDNKIQLDAAIANSDQAIIDNQAQLDTAIASANQTVSNSATLSQSNVSNFIEASSQELTQERITQSEMVQILSDEVDAKILDIDALFAQALTDANRNFTVSGDPNSIILTSKQGTTPINTLKNFDEFTFIVSATNTLAVTIAIDGMVAIPLSNAVLATQIFGSALLTIRYIDGSFYIADQVNPKTGNSVSDIGSLIFSAVSTLQRGEVFFNGGSLNRADHPIAFTIASASSNYISQATKDSDLTAYGSFWGDGNGTTTFTLPLIFDKFVKASGGSRSHASYESTDNLSHSHGMGVAGNHAHNVTFYIANGGGGTNPVGFSSVGGPFNKGTSAGGNHTHTINASGGGESRPNNYALNAKTRL
jgi:hypothetical protein